MTLAVPASAGGDGSEAGSRDGNVLKVFVEVLVVVPNGVVLHSSVVDPVSALVENSIVVVPCGVVVVVVVAFDVPDAPAGPDDPPECSGVRLRLRSRRVSS